jgi:hypothetical protein
VSFRRHYLLESANGTAPVKEAAAKKEGSS